MATYTMTCSQGHDPVVLSVQANDDDEAMMLMMDKSKAHNSESHKDMTMSDEEMKTFIQTNWKKEEM